MGTTIERGQRQRSSPFRQPRPVTATSADSAPISSTPSQPVALPRLAPYMGRRLVWVGGGWEDARYQLSSGDARASGEVVDVRLTPLGHAA